MNSNSDTKFKSKECLCCNLKKKNSNFNKKSNGIYKSNQLSFLIQLNQILDQEISDVKKDIDEFMAETKLCDCDDKL